MRSHGTDRETPAEDPDEIWVDIGKVGKPFGLKGEVVVHPFGDTVDRFGPGSEVFAVTAGGMRALRVAAVRRMPKKLVIRFEGMTRIEDVQPYVNCGLQVREQDLPPLEGDENYYFQLVGLRVYAADGRFVGILEEILSTAGNDVYCVRESGRETLIPAIREAIARVDLDAGRMELGDLEGMIEP